MILVTGGDGYIGSHTCVQRLEAGHEVVVLDNFSNSKPEALRRVEKITGRAPLLGEDMLRDLDRAEPDWSMAIRHYFNPVGAHPSGLIGKDPNGTRTTWCLSSAKLQLPSATH